MANFRANYYNSLGFQSPEFVKELFDRSLVRPRLDDVRALVARFGATTETRATLWRFLVGGLSGNRLSWHAVVQCKRDEFEDLKGATTTIGEIAADEKDRAVVISSMLQAKASFERARWKHDVKLMQDKEFLCKVGGVVASITLDDAEAYWILNGIVGMFFKPMLTPAELGWDLAALLADGGIRLHLAPAATSQPAPLDRKGNASHTVTTPSASGFDFLFEGDWLRKSKIAQTLLDPSQEHCIWFWDRAIAMRRNPFVLLSAGLIVANKAHCLSLSSEEDLRKFLMHQSKIIAAAKTVAALEESKIIR